ncbi:MAG: thiol:disulfide interchange protein DsbG [Porticoccaceae bacterium]
MSRTFSRLLRALSASVCVFAAQGQADAERPAVLDVLEAQGLHIVQEFEVGGGVRGFAAAAGQQPMAVYVTQDGAAIVGTRIGEDGVDLDEQQLQELVAKPMGERMWTKLETSAWVQDGDSKAARIIYTFSDPNCPYCNRFWQAARPWVEAGKVQLRHVMVGIIKEDSATKAAAILAAKDTSAALAENETNFSKGGITPAKSVSTAVRESLDANQLLMMELGFRGTPALVFHDESGAVQRYNGMPQGEDLTEVMGPR